jgi:hypothetical protein
MGDRDAFYVAGNIIGYTGEPHASPTVYFRHGDEFGHITQKHPIAQNIGREQVYSDPQYQIQNQMYSGEYICCESIAGKVFHHSRSIFVSAANLKPLDKTLLAQSIYFFPDFKLWDTLTDDQRRILIRAQPIPTVDVKALSRQHLVLIAKANA